MTSYLAAVGFLASNGHDVSSLKPMRTVGRGNRVTLTGVDSKKAEKYAEVLKGSKLFGIVDFA